MIYEIVCILAGLWLHLYRLAIRTRGRQLVEYTTQCSLAIPITLLYPLFPWSSSPWTKVVIAVVGVLMVCSPCNFFMYLPVAFVMGIHFTGLLWHIGCSGSGATSTSVYECVLYIPVSIALLVFLCTQLSKLYWERAVVPSVAALTLTYGVFGLLTLDVNGLTPEALLLQAPCDDASSTVAIVVLIVWVVLGLIGAVLQAKLLVETEDRTLGGEGETGLVTSLLPLSAEDTNLFTYNEQPLIVQALTDPHFDFSKLDEKDMRYYELICNNEDERDRLLMGGGLY